MTRKQVATLKEGDRVRWTIKGDEIEGTVMDQGYAAINISWDDGTSSCFPHTRCGHVQRA